ncbi:MAG TPA: hypothetical protein VGM12_15150 [Trebonia sp.]
MSVGAVIAIVVVLVILAVVAALATRMMRRSAERRSLGPEYSRLVDEVGTRKANAEYDKRRHRVEGLGITPLSEERRTLYSTQWLAAQESFIDNPVESVRSARALVTAVAADRGYEVTDAGQLQTDLSVYHGSRLDGYRSALRATDGTGDVATEKLRQALLDYRAMFRDLAEINDADDETVATTAAQGTTADPRPAADPVTTVTPAAVTPAPAEETNEGTGHRVFWRRESRETSGVAGNQS